MKLAFVDFFRVGYTCDTPYSNPLGGSQSAVAYLTAALARRGHDVTVVNGVRIPVSSAGVAFVGRDRLTSSFLNQFDVVIVASVALGRELRAAGIARPLLLWCQHDTDQLAVQNLLSPEERAAWNGFAMVSRWQADRYVEVLDVSRTAQCVLGNAVSPAFENLSGIPRWFERGDAPVLYYTSTPFRGLDVLIDAMPALRIAVPGIRLRVFSSMKVYGIASQDDRFAMLYEKCRNTDGVEYVGSLPQQSLATAMSAADILAYPCTFPETSCISAMEAMSVGSMIVSTRLGALHETTAGFAFLMETQGEEPVVAEEYSTVLIGQIKEAAAQPGPVASRLSAQRQFVRDHYSWERRAGEWERWLSGFRDADPRARSEVPETALSTKGAGNVLKAVGEPEEAIALYRRSLEIEPDYVPALYNLGLALHDTGRLDQAEECFRRVAAIEPGDTEVLIHIGAILCRRSQFVEAAETFRKALDVVPGDPRLWLWLATALRDIPGRTGESIECLRQAISLDPGFADAYYELGATYRKLGDMRQAADALGKVLELRPDSAEAANDLAVILLAEGKLDQAIECYRAAIRVRPDSAAAHVALGCALIEAGRLADADENLRTAIDLQPDNAEGHLNLGNLRSMQGAHDEALQCYETALRLRPGDPVSGEAVLCEAQRICDWRRFAELSEMRRRSVFEPNARPVNPFSLLSIASTRAEQLRCARDYARDQHAAVAHSGAPFKFDRQARGKLRVGYFSSDFHSHPVAHLIAELFELHDRSRFEVMAYSCGPDDGSPMRARLKRAFDRFTDIAPLSHAAAAGVIHACGTDILVDLSGYTQNARPGVAALRPAPVQVNYLGYPGTMGADFIDYLIADRFLIPAAHAAEYSEKLVLLPGSYQANDRKRPVAPTPPRRELGLPEDGFVFCCFNHAFKILPDVFSVWMRLLQSVPGSILWLLESNPWVGRNLRREAQSRGVDPQRLVFAPLLPVDLHLGRVAAADLFLDTAPYNAHTTASDALWAGLPVLTVSGDTFASRVAGSLLSAVGLPELVAGSMGEYEALALKLVREPELLRSLRSRLARNRNTAPLFDTPRLARHLESAYEIMWRHYQSGGGPRAIEL